MQGSVVLHQLSTKHQDDTDDQQQLIKAQIRVGWSAEAVKQGVTLAKKGEYDSAIGCYKKVKGSTNNSFQVCSTSVSGSMQCASCMTNPLWGFEQIWM